MGILDDAIREHLDLKRQHGARDSEIKELEDEAFGPPSRPGEPDFPERPPTSEEPVLDDAFEAQQPGPPGDEASQAFEASEQPPTQMMESPVAPDAPALEDEEAPASARDPVPDSEAGEEDAPALFDHQAMEEDLGLEDLDLKLDEGEESRPPPAVSEPEPVDEESVEVELDLGAELDQLAPEEPAEPAIDAGVPTEEHPFEDELVEEPAPAPEPASAPEPGLGEETSEEDVLEETPEFLRDAPENEDLWFEQGAPKDFDFEDDEED